MRCAILLCVMLSTATATPLAPVTLGDLAWLSGCWAREDAEPGSEEHWTSPAGGVMLGMSRTLRGGKVIEYEFMEIRELSAGRLAYVAHPSRQAEATFPLLRSVAGEVVFENPAHDFPQRIIYRLPADPGRLIARIEGEQGGKSRGIDYPMRRMACVSP